MGVTNEGGVLESGTRDRGEERLSGDSIPIRGGNIGRTGVPGLLILWRGGGGGGDGSSVGPITYGLAMADGSCIGGVIVGGKSYDGSSGWSSSLS